ncbi:MAG: hypothetical protein HY703_01540 [Gemmatimonadetes bacterium]|nr:hypothetical protein [Gemmatimonadota bacterium]
MMSMPQNGPPVGAADRGGASAETVPSAEPEGISLLTLVNLLLRRRRMVVGLPLVAFVAGALFTAAPSRQFVAQSMFVTGEGQSASRVSGIAAQLGFTGGGPRDQSPDFYKWLLSSRDLLRQVALTEYTIPMVRETGAVDTVRGTLLEILHGPGGQLSQEDEKAQLAGAAKMIAGGVEIKVDAATGFLVLITRAAWRELAVQLNRRLLELVHQFNLDRRRSQVGVERKFVEERLEIARAELEKAEAALQQFLEENRGYIGASHLAFEQKRLERRVDLRLQIYSSLAQSNEQMRIEEARNTPLITVIEQPENTVEAEIRGGRSPVSNGVLAALAALVFSVGLAFLLEFLKRQLQANPREYSELQELSREAVGDLIPARLLAWARGLRNGAAPPEAEAPPVRVAAGVGEPEDRPE